MTTNYINKILTIILPFLNLILLGLINHNSNFLFNYTGIVGDFKHFMIIISILAIITTIFSSYLEETVKSRVSRITFILLTILNSIFKLLYVCFTAGLSKLVYNLFYMLLFKLDSIQFLKSIELVRIWTKEDLTKELNILIQLTDVNFTELTKLQIVELSTNYSTLKANFIKALSEKLNKVELTQTVNSIDQVSFFTKLKLGLISLKDFAISSPGTVILGTVIVVGVAALLIISIPKVIAFFSSKTQERIEDELNKINERVTDIVTDKVNETVAGKIDETISNQLTGTVHTTIDNIVHKQLRGVTQQITEVRTAVDKLTLSTEVKTDLLEGKQIETSRIIQTMSDMTCRDLKFLNQSCEDLYHMNRRLHGVVNGFEGSLKKVTAAVLTQNNRLREVSQSCNTIDTRVNSVFSTTNDILTTVINLIEQPCFKLDSDSVTYSAWNAVLNSDMLEDPTVKNTVNPITPPSLDKLKNTLIADQNQLTKK